MIYEITIRRFGFVRTFVVTASCHAAMFDEIAGSRFVPVQRSSLGYGGDERRKEGWKRGRRLFCERLE